MNLDVAAVIGLPYSGCESCDQVVVMGESSAEDIAWAWETHRKGPVHLAGGIRKPDPEIDMTPPEMFYEEHIRGAPVDAVATESVNDHPMHAAYATPYGPYGYPLTAMAPELSQSTEASERTSPACAS